MSASMPISKSPRRGDVLWRHLWLDESDARRLLGRDGLGRLTQQVRDSELHHLGEIRICIEAALPLRRLLAGCSPRARAIELFTRLGVGKTGRRNGVLVYLLLADHAVEVVVDPALRAQVPDEQWQPVVAVVQRHFSAGEYEQGLAEAVNLVDTLLRRHVPAAGGGSNPNELPDEPVVL